MHHFILNDLSPRERYKLLTGVVVPRPIAFTTTLTADGLVNAAPFSYFNVMGTDPAVVVLGPGNRADGSKKDTARNIADQREFVINMVDEDLAAAMNNAATPFPPGVSEVDALHLETLPSVQVAPPRLAASPVHLECREVTTLTHGQTRIVVGEVLALHIQEHLLDPERFYVDGQALNLVGRMQGRTYTRTTDTFDLARQSYADWQKSQPDS